MAINKDSLPLFHGEFQFGIALFHLLGRTAELLGDFPQSVARAGNEYGYRAVVFLIRFPFLFPVKFEEGYIAEAEATVCGLSVRQRREGEAEAEATLKVTLKLYKETTAEYISEIEEGEILCL